MSLKCEKCGHTKFRTIKKQWEYQCRKCGHIFFNMNVWIMDTDAPAPVRVGDAKYEEVHDPEVHDLPITANIVYDENNPILPDVIKDTTQIIGDLGACTPY